MSALVADTVPVAVAEAFEWDALPRLFLFDESQACPAYELKVEAIENRRTQKNDEEEDREGLPAKTQVSPAAASPKSDSAASPAAAAAAAVAVPAFPRSGAAGGAEDCNFCSFCSEEADRAIFFAGQGWREARVLPAVPREEEAGVDRHLGL